jgi:hypothetical protein
MVVSLGQRQPLTSDSLADTVTRVPGEYPSDDEAIQAAKRYIDAADAGRQEKAGKNKDAPASA